MFEMLDYRAHKLYWLINLPFVIAAKIAFYVLILISILIAEQFSYGVFLKIGIAYVLLELLSLVAINVLWGLIFSGIRRVFFGSSILNQLMAKILRKQKRWC